MSACENAAQGQYALKIYDQIFPPEVRCNAESCLILTPGINIYNYVTIL